MIVEPKPSKIVSIKDMSSDVRLFRVRSKLNPLPGQFLQVSVIGVGECPLASCSFSGNYVDLLVRKVGRVTGGMFNLKRGDNLFIRGPYGNGYALELLKGKNLFLFAGGTGIAPVTSLIEYISGSRKDFGEVNIFFGFRSEKNILLYERIKKWSRQFKVHISIDEKPVKIKAEIGGVAKSVGRHKFNTENCIAIMCGPEEMMSAITRELNKSGLQDDKIYWNTERRMECAVGSCGRCLIQDIYTCKDGPVFRYDFIKEKIENEAKK